MGTNSGIYKLLLVLHLLAVTVGLGTVFLNGVYNARARRFGGERGTAVTVANEEVSKIAEYAIYAIPVFGILMVLTSDDAIQFGDTWIWLSLLIYVIAIGISHAVLIPGHRRYNQLAESEGGPSAGEEAQGLEKRMAAAGGTLNVLVVVLIALMVWKPGA